MKLALAALFGGLLLLAPGATTSPVQAQARTVDGTIVGFECGDNCYLTIRTRSGRIQALCNAPICEKWFENQAMPRRFVGKRVTVTIDVGDQVDSEGNVMGQTDAFTEIEFQ